jgi:hypothetical protein
MNKVDNVFNFMNDAALQEENARLRHALECAKVSFLELYMHPDQEYRSREILRMYHFTKSSLEFKK